MPPVVVLVNKHSQRASHPLGQRTSIHCVRELHKDRVFLHDALDVGATNTDDAFVILVGDMERDGGGHLLFDQAQPLLHRVVTGGHDINVEIVLVEAIKDDLHIA